MTRDPAGVMLVAGLPLLTAGQRHLGLADDLLIYLVAVVVVAVVGGFWPAVLAAVTSSILLNWYFTRPVRTLTIADPKNLLALLLFITVAVTVSSVVHLAAHRAQQAARSGEEAAGLLTLAQTVLGGADTPAAARPPDRQLRRPSRADRRPVDPARRQRDGPTSRRFAIPSTITSGMLVLVRAWG